MKNIKELGRKLVDNKIVVSLEETLPRYSIETEKADYWWDNGEFEDYLLDSKVVSYSIAYKWLNNCEYENESRNGSEVLEDFTKWVNKNYKDYSVYVLQEYRHSGSVFHLTKTTNKVDEWDSGIVGFMALPNNMDSGHLADMITDVYEGNVDIVKVVDNLTGDVLEEYEFWGRSGDYKEECKIREHIKKEFNCEW